MEEEYEDYAEGMSQQFDGEIHVCKDGEYHASDAQDCSDCNDDK